MKKTLFLTASAIFLLSYTGCKKFELVTKTIYTQPEINNITYYSVSVSTEILEVGENLKSYGHCYGTESMPTIENGKTVSPGSNATIGTFTEEISDLNPNTIYFLRPYAEEDEIRYGKNEQTFTTQNPALPTVTTNEVTNINSNTAICGGNVLNEGISNVTARGVCWSTSQNPTISDSRTEDGIGIGTFTSSLTGLTESTNYYVRAYATNTEGTSYGEQKNFTTPELTTPVVTTADITNISYTTATSGGNVTNAGSSAVSGRGVCWSTSQNPAISDNHTTDGSGTGTFISNLTNLTEYTTYYVRAYATNTEGTSYGDQKSFTTLEIVNCIDYDGNIYDIVEIGNQIWMAEDLKVTHYPNGDIIPLETNDTNWGNLADINTADAYCFYNNNSNSDYGALYTYAAAIGDNWTRDNNTDQGVCPDEWHLPSDTEWAELINYLGGASVAGGKMKEPGTTHWNDPNEGATNTSGFTALPGGLRYSIDGNFQYLGMSGYWWSATEETGTNAWRRSISHTNTSIGNNNVSKSFGFSVRCIKDE